MSLTVADQTENEERSSERADRADRRADAADARATGADLRASGADVRATAADARTDVTVALAHERMMESLKPLEDKLDGSIRARNRIAAALLVFSFLIGSIGYVDFWTDRRRDYQTCVSRQKALGVLREVIIRATPPRVPPDAEADAKINEFRRSLLDAVPTLECKRPGIFLIPGVR